MDIAASMDQWEKIKESRKNENKNREILRPCKRAEETVKNEGDGGTSSRWYTWKDPQRIWKRMDELELKRRIETTQTTARILRRVPETWGDLLSLKLLREIISW